MEAVFMFALYMYIDVLCWHDLSNMINWKPAVDSV